MPFNFQYAVNDAESANDYNHNAVSDGDVTRGEYRVQLPDGRTQIVKYTADWKNGYNAEVRTNFVKNLCSQIKVAVKLLPAVAERNNRLSRKTSL